MTGHVVSLQQRDQVRPHPACVCCDQWQTVHWNKTIYCPGATKLKHTFYSGGSELVSQSDLEKIQKKIILSEIYTWPFSKFMLQIFTWWHWLRYLDFICSWKCKEFLWCSRTSSLHSCGVSGSCEAVWSSVLCVSYRLHVEQY